MPDDASMEAELTRYKELTDATNNKPIVIISADDSSKQQRFVDLLNALARVDITTVTLSGFSSD